MKVLLVRNHDIGDINTRLPESLNRAQGIYPPLGIAYIASFLEQNGIDVKILDVKALNLTKEETYGYIERENPDIVGVTSMTPNWRGALEICEMAKKIEKGILTVVGGSQVSVFPEEVVSNSCVDVGISGDGEYSMLDLVIRKRNKLKIPQLMLGERVEMLDVLPSPARHLLPNKKYWCVIAEHPFTTMITSRGCPFNCGFCYSIDRKVRFRSAENVVDEMEEVVEKYGFKEIMFYDDVFTLSKKRVTAICKEIISRGLDVCWETPTRVDLINERLLILMQRAGCIRIRYGVESGDANILKLMNKGTTLEQVERAFELTKKTGIETFAYFMIGYVHETTETIRRTISFAKKLNPDWVMFTVVTPLPETKLYEEAVELELVDEEYWKDFTLGKRDDRMPFLVEDADKWVNRAYREFYFRPSFILRKLSKIDSIGKLKRDVQGAWGIFRFEMN